MKLYLSKLKSWKLDRKILQIWGYRFRRLFKKALPWIYGIHPYWSLNTKLRCRFSKKIKVGFGPITTGENDLAERKWRIDPVINGINQTQGNYVAGFFTCAKQMKRFDIVVIVKKINPEIVSVIHTLKNKRFIYDIVDNPNDEEKYRFYFRFLPGLIDKMDGFILSSPLHSFWIKEMKRPSLLIEHPILNSVHKTKYENGNEIRILAQGYFENLQNLRWLEPLLPRLSKELGKPIRLYYHTEVKQPDTEYVRYLKWSVKSCFSVMAWADIAITMKDLHKPYQYTKPSTKAIAYMAAGLPVICKPTAADRLVIRDKITGFFAYREEDWLYWIRSLSLQVALRRQIGRAARKSVLQNYSLKHILKKYNSIFEAVHIEI